MPIGPDNSVYTAVARSDGSYAVEIVRTGEPPRFEEGFKDQQAADLWIFAQVERGSSDLPSYAGPQDSLPGFPGSRG